MAKPTTQQVQPATSEDFGNQQTVELLAFQIWAATVAGKVLSEMSAFMDELIESHLLDDDDEEADGEEADEGDRHKREKKLLGEAIADALDTYPDINAIANLPLSSDPDIRTAAEQLKDYLVKCPIGATEIKDRLSRPQLERKRGANHAQPLSPASHAIGKSTSAAGARTRLPR